MSALPKTMRVVDVPKPGGPEALVVVERPVPVPQSNEVLIQVTAAGLNRADVLQRRGFYPSPQDAPPWPGLEAAGVVVAVGERVTEFAPGDRVCALLQGGGYAEFCAAPEAQTLRVPRGLDLIEAAALPEACFTVWSNVFELGRLAPGERLLVHGGSSGIGVTAIQLAAALGSAVYTTAGSNEKCRFCESLGATQAVNYRREDFVAVLKEATGGYGVDVVLDMVGGDYLPRNLDLLAPQGRIVNIATQGGARADIDLRLLMTKRATLTGSTLRPRPAAFKGEIKQKLLARVWPLIEAGAVQTIIDRTYPFDDAAQAHAYMESSAHMGKILLTVG